MAEEGQRTISIYAADVTVEPDGLVVVRVNDIDMGADEMRAILEARFSFGYRLAPVLVDARRVRSMSREAQEISAAPAVQPYTNCIGIIVQSPVSVILANFFMVFVKPVFPTRMFRSEEAARAWLQATRTDKR